MKRERAIFWQMAVIVLLFSLAVTGCGAAGSAPSDSKTEYVIRLGHSDTEDNLINVSLQHYADYVKENTQGRVVIRLYPNEELGDNTDMAQQLVSGLRMRIPDDKMTEAIFRALGARTTVFSWNRTYDALKQGTFDGEENPIANIYANKINEVNQYLTITNHKYETKNLVFSQSTWKKLPKDLQQVLLEGAAIYGKEHRETVAAQQDKQLEELKESGMIVNESPDIDAFKVATRGVYTDFELQNEWTSNLVARIRKVISQN